ncbi:hypothetical protein B7P43_G11315 [Cryptotermes secundus]|uniref:Anaphase-promoting complex subunit 4-like WD40 domain-containing protein n=1 Tax=Cryptotermes secundus TaxID=105785 RepID=A0A2J7RAA1_9NEOP|nr:hypothetical protein B7P43_G11315 [Cryptotermes secundus]
MFVPDVEIIVGTYEEFLLGYKTIKKEDAKCYLVQSFADHSHRASIRSVCANGKFLASGSADETIHVYDMNARKESGILVHHIGKEQRSWIKIECARGCKARQCHQGLQEACRESALPYRTVARCVKAFNEGCQNVADMRQPGRPSVSEEDIAQPHAAQAVADLFNQWGWEVLYHLPYSPDLSPCTVNCLSFSPNGSHLLSGGEDGSIAIFRTGSWQLEKVFAEAHKGEAVTLLSVHPSGKLALSVGTDATLRTWNLVKGRQAYATNLGKNRTGKGRAVSCLLWSPDGSMYVIAVGTEVSVYDVHTAGIMHTFQLAKKVTCICFSQVTQLVVGDEGGGLSVHSISDREQLNTFDAHKHRVKSVSFISIKDKHFLASASSSGQIKLWNCKGGKLREICHTNSDCRITCLLMLEAPQSRQLNQKHIKEECMQTHSTDISAGSETRVRSKRLRKDGGDSHLASRTLDDKAVNRNSELSPTACSFNVICTRGQKWLVEEL